jgi:hypothetical protein
LQGAGEKCGRRRPGKIGCRRFEGNGGARPHFDGFGGTAINDGMSGISYYRLSKGALDLLERDQKERQLFLDFLVVLEDVLASKSAGPEPALFTSKEREEKALKLSKSLTAKAGLRAAAVANRVPLHVISGSFVTIITTEILGRTRGRCVCGVQLVGLGALPKLLTEAIEVSFGLLKKIFELDRSEWWRIGRYGSGGAGGRSRTQSNGADIEIFLEAVELEKIG